jgi:hypothetical protein
MKATLLVILLLTLSDFAAASREDPRTQRELEDFYGAEYVSLTAKQTRRLARAAIKAQNTGICNIHHVQMEKKRVPIYFGLPDFSNPYYSNERSRFPNAREYVNGGCEVDPAAEKKRYPRFVCPACKRAERRWALAHPKNDIAKHISAQR